MTLEGVYDPGADRVVRWGWRARRIERSIETEAAAAFPSPAGDLVAVLRHWRARSQAVEIREARTGRLVASLVGHTGDVNDLVFRAEVCPYP